MSSLPSLSPRLRQGSGRMERIDRLGWRSATCFDSHGLRVGLRCNQPGLLERLEPHLPPGWTAAASPVVDQVFSLWVGRSHPTRGGRHIHLYAGPSRRLRTSSLDEALALLESEIRQGVAAGSCRRTFVHAGVVGWAGRAILVPGRSRSGKTTLVAELVRAGATYYSDEFAPLDGRGRVHPFPKLLSVRGEAGCDVHVRPTRPEELGGVVGREPLPVGLVVLASYRPGADWRPVPVGPGQAVLEMLAHTVPARLRPAASLRALARAVAGARVLKGERGEAPETAAKLLEAVEERVRSSRRRAGQRGMR